MRTWLIVALSSLFIGATSAAAVKSTSEPVTTAVSSEDIVLRRYQYLIEWEGGTGAAGPSGQGAVLWEHNVALEQHNAAFVNAEGALVGRGIDERGTAMLLPSEGQATQTLGLLAFSMLLGPTLSPDSISDWLEGKDSSTWIERATVTSGKDGRVNKLVEGGWAVTYLAWGSTTEGTKTQVPAKVQLQKDGLRVTLTLLEAGAYPADALPSGYRPFKLMGG